MRLPYYAGKEFARMERSDGGLLHAVGAQNYQVTRANRAHPEESDGLGYTYNHAPMTTYWRGRFYIEYLGNPVSEHTGAGTSFLCVSEDGVSWTKPVPVFPPLRVGPCEHVCADGERVLIPEPRDAVMHQRMGFFHSADDRLLACGFYGQTDTPHRVPWVNYGIGRVVREVYADGSMGDIFFVRILEDAGWRENELPYPLFDKSPDPGFVKACRELLRDRLTTQQWAEEHGMRDPYVSFKGAVNENGKPCEAFCWYHTDENTVVGMWKHAVVGVSEDGGVTWRMGRENSFATSGGKMWGQRTADGRYAAAYLNSLGSEHRYPLVVVTSEDGARFDGMAVAFGETPPRRYDGLFKDFGPQYLRGICEGHAEYPRDALWLCHSVNKEDIWMTRVPLPIRREETRDVDEGFDAAPDAWNLYSPLWAPIRRATLPDGSACLRIADADPVDYARAMRVFPAAERVSVTLEIMAAAAYEESLEIELASPDGTAVCLVEMRGDCLRAQTTSVRVDLCPMPRGVAWHALTLDVDLSDNTYAVSLDGASVTSRPLRVIQRVNEVQRVLLRTKPARKAPGMDVRPDTPDMPDADTRAPERVYYLRRIRVERRI